MPQLNSDDLKGMTPEAIVLAYENDECAELLGADPQQAALLDRAHDPKQHLSATDIKALRAAGRPDLIVEALEQDRINFNTGDN